jgi:hypothetical protein
VHEQQGAAESVGFGEPRHGGVFIGGHRVVDPPGFEVDPGDPGTRARLGAGDANAAGHFMAFDRNGGLSQPRRLFAERPFDPFGFPHRIARHPKRLRDQHGQLGVHQDGHALKAELRLDNGPARVFEVTDDVAGPGRIRRHQVDTGMFHHPIV